MFYGQLSQEGSGGIPEELRPALEPLLETIASLSTRIRHYDRELEQLAEEHYAQTKLLRQVQGVETLTALSFVLTLEDPGRFEESRSVGAYLGLVPSKDQSGERDPQKCRTGGGSGGKYHCIPLWWG